MVGTKGLDLEKFQFDTDQSFAVFLLNADGTIYARFGTRSHRTLWADDVSLAGMAKAMEGALRLHSEYPQNGAVLSQKTRKTGTKPEFPTPESCPTLKGRFGSSLDYGGNVVKSCIHCHKIGDALREWHRSQSGPMPEDVLFPFPHPKSIGLILDPKECATVLRVEPGSPAAKAGIRTGDAIVMFELQPILSLADVQWVLQSASSMGEKLQAQVLRDGEILSLTLRLEAGWRRKDDISWRASTWTLRRMATGGMLLKSATLEERREAGLAADAAALRVEHVGQFAPHDVAKRAGFLKGDVITSFDGRQFVRETDLIAHVLTNCDRGKKVEVEVVRRGSRKNLPLTVR